MKPDEKPALIRTREDFDRAFGVSRETLDRLDTYAALLRQWQPTINLVAPGTLDVVWHRHFADSAQLLALAPPEARRVLDIGSGAGFPGMVLAIMLRERPECRVTLVESDSRKAAFLRELARTTGAPVDILCARIESPATHAKVGKVEVVTARALAPLERLFGLAYPFYSPATVGLFLKGRDIATEVAGARERWSFTAEMLPSVTATDGSIAVVSELRAKSEGRGQ